MTKLIKPLRDIYITQSYGVNLVGKGFYSQFGLSSDCHNGIDLRARVGCPVYATHDGIVIKKKSSSFGSYIVLNNVINGDGFDTIYGHLSVFLTEDGQSVKQGDIIALSGDTGSASKGPHLHFAYREWMFGHVINYNNGYLGSLNPADYMPKNWDKPNAYHRYGRTQNLLAEIIMRFKNVWLHRRLLKINKLNLIYDTTFINALVYGGWDVDTCLDPAMQDWKWVTKDAFNKGDIAFK